MLQIALPQGLHAASVVAAWTSLAAGRPRRQRLLQRIQFCGAERRCGKQCCDATDISTRGLAVFFCNCTLAASLRMKLRRAAMKSSAGAAMKLRWQLSVLRRKGRRRFPELRCNLGAAMELRRRLPALRCSARRRPEAAKRPRWCIGASPVAPELRRSMLQWSIACGSRCYSAAFAGSVDSDGRCIAAQRRRGCCIEALMASMTVAWQLPWCRLRPLHRSSGDVVAAALKLRQASRTAGSHLQQRLR